MAATLQHIIPTSAILHETLFTEFQGLDFLPPVLYHRHYVRGATSARPEDGQCLSLSAVETMQSKSNLRSIKRSEAMPPGLSVQHLVDAMTPKPINYKQAVFDYLKHKGIVTAADYEAAPVGHC
ncbi:hypothetical protein RND81_11G090600 [Saponaria officinalis]|uniref:Uncharacterized protein n=1 Tax=Saponaria officinalis TaxID=3572 RepID=A0AAW1HJV2_SAPOF